MHIDKMSAGLFGRVVTLPILSRIRPGKVQLESTSAAGIIVFFL